MVDAQSPPSSPPPPAAGVRMAGIWRTFGSNTALRDVEFTLRPGEVHALLGENGAGKSTLMRILAGLLPADAGRITVDGTELSELTQLSKPSGGRRGQIAMVHQHFMLVPTMTVAENVMLGTERGVVTGRCARAVRAELVDLAERTGLQLRPDARIEDLSVGEQQRVEILRALRLGARFLILDEPTANLAPTEVTALLDRVRALARDHGIGVAVITHHLDEVMAAADRVTVLRHGEHVASMDIAATAPRELARLMVGRDVELDRRMAAASPTGEPRLRLAGVSTRQREHTVALSGIDIAVRAGEILAVAGVDGNGQAELEDLVSGLIEVDSGNVAIDGVDVTGAPPRRLHSAGLNTIPADRYRRGLAASLGIDANLVLDRFTEPPVRTRWGLSPTAIQSRARAVIERMGIAAPAPSTPAGHLSGGHAQRVVLGRVLDGDLAVLVAAQPTRGLDVGATEFVWSNLARLRDRGVAVLLISSDLEEILCLADRCAVLYRGRIAARFDQGPFDRESVGAAMGGKATEPAGAPAEASTGAGGER